MAKDVTQKFNLDVTQAAQAVRTMTKQIDKYNTQAKKVADASKEQAKQFGKLNPRLETFNTRTKELNSSTLSLNRAITTQVERTRSLNAAVNRNVAAFGRSSDILNTVNASLRSSAKSAETFAEQFKTANKTMKTSNKRLSKSSEHLRDFNTEIKKVIKSMRQKDAGLDRQRGKHLSHNKAVRAGSRDIKQLGISFLTAGKIIVTLAIHRAVLRITQAVIHARKEAQDFSKAIGEVKTIQDEAALTTEQWQKNLSRLATDFGLPSVEAAEAAYQSLSNQIVNAGQTQAFLREEIKLSITAVTSLDQSVAATTAILNAWGMESTRAREVNEILFATVKRGRLRLTELSDTIGRVSILSSQLGISIIEQNAAIALLTRQGIKAEEAITLLRNVELKLVKPTETMEKLFNQWGVTSGEAAIRAFGLVGVLNKIEVAASKGGDQMAELGNIFGRIRAIVGASGLDAKLFTKEIDELVKATKEYDKAFGESFGSTGKQLEVQFGRAKAVLIDQFLIPFNRTLLKTIKWLGGLDNVLLGVAKVIRFAVIAFASYKAAVVTVSAVQAIYAARLVMSTGILANYTAATTAAAIATARLAAVTTISTAGLTLLIGAVLLSASSFETMEDRTRRAGSELERLGTESRRPVFEGLLTSMNTGFTTFNMNMTNTFRLYQRTLAMFRAANNELKIDFAQKFKDIGKSIQEGLKAPLKAVQEQLNQLRRSASQLQGAATTRRGVVRDRKFNEAEAQFRANINQLPELKQLEALNKKKVELGLRANAALAKNNDVEADKLFRAVERFQQEIVRRVQAINQDANRKVDIKQKFRFRQFDPLTGRNRIVTKNVKVGERLKDPDAAARTLAILNQLEQERRAIVTQRIAAEEAFIKRQEAAAKQQKAIADQRERALSKFRDTLAQLDAFDIDAKGVGAFRTLVKTADVQGKLAGLGPKERLAFLREAAKQEVLLKRKAEQQAAKESLDIAQKTINERQAQLEEATKRRQTLARDALQAAESSFGKVEKFIGEFQATPRSKQGLREGESLNSEIGAVKQALSQFKQFPTAATVKEVQKKIAELRQALFTKGAIFQPGPGAPRGGAFSLAPQTTGAVTKLDEATGKITAANVKLREHQKVQGDLQKQVEGLKQEFQKLPGAIKNGVNAAEEAAKRHKAANEEQKRSLRGVLKEFLKIEEAHRRAAATGGRPRNFASGGRQGIDVNPAFIANGETVMNRAASARFAPLLHAINTTTPQIRDQEAGSVNFGDINISAPEGSTDVQLDAIARGLERRVRQGRLKL